MDGPGTLGARSHGVWTRAEALGVLSRHVVHRLLRDGIWQVPLPGVYADAGHRLDDTQRAVAAVLATGAPVPAVVRWRGDGQGCELLSPAAVVCGRTAARLWGMVLIDDDDPATAACDHVVDDVWTRWGLGGRTAPPDETGQPPYRLLRHRFELAGGDLLRRPDGLVVTTAVRTAVDCARLLSREALVCLLDDGLRRRLFTPADLRDAAEQRAGRPGCRRFAWAVSQADGRAESPNETLARLLLRPVVPDLEPQVVIADDCGVPVARADLASRKARLAVELDGRAGHAGERMLAKDQRRDRQTTALGWLTLRATWYDVRRRQDEFVARVRTAHRARTARAG